MGVLRIFAGLVLLCLIQLGYLIRDDQSTIMSIYDILEDDNDDDSDYSYVTALKTVDVKKKVSSISINFS